MVKRVVASTDAPPANGCYSQGILAGGFLFVSGQLPINPDTMEKVTGDVQTQTRQVLDNIKAIVTEAGGTMADIVKVNIYLSNMDDWGLVNHVYSEYFVEDPPARCCVEAPRLHYGFDIEVEVVAYLG